MNLSSIHKPTIKEISNKHTHLNKKILTCQLFMECFIYGIVNNEVIITAKIILDTDLFKIGNFFTILGTILSAISITAKLKMKIGNESNRILSHSYFKNFSSFFHVERSIRPILQTFSDNL